jgi:FHA domain
MRVADMPESVLAVLKLVFLAVLYLFLARVIRAVWVEIYAERRSAAENVHAGIIETPSKRSKGDVPVPVITAEKLSKRDVRKAEKVKAGYVLKVVEPPEQKGTTYAIVDEMTIGRAAACAVPIRDDFASQLHARVFRRDGDVFCEDLGSTNGTFLNKKPVHGPNRLTKGDRIQVGNTVLEFTK